MPSNQLENALNETSVASSTQPDGRLPISDMTFLVKSDGFDFVPCRWTHLCNFLRAA
jgi:hypothetical protein